jgi:dihydrofolate synthase/folylpolyglutamate synthase
MTYSETINYLYSAAPMFQQIGSAAYKEGLENTLRIDAYLQHPHRRYATIHVAGTNGKGSVSHLLASVLQEAGYKVGLYTSPHLVDFRERIRINGQMIDEAYVVDFVAQHRAFMESLQPSFFEWTTAMAFAAFADREVDIAVIEVGLGGRLDCTNIITPLISIITNISLDHTKLLGDTPTAIAREKAGIIKPETPVVIGEATDEVKAVFEEVRTARWQGREWVYAQETNPIRSARLLPSGYWELETDQYPELIDELGGLAQEKNAATVLCAIRILNHLPDARFRIPPKAVYRGFRYVVENTGLLGRWQVVQQRPKIVLDTGHNLGGIAYIVRQLQSEHYRHLHIVFGMVNDKDIRGVLALLPTTAVYYFTQAAIPRALDARQLAAQAAEFGLHGEAYPSVAAALDAACQAADAADFIFVGGSTFVVAEAELFYHTATLCVSAPVRTI